MKKHGLIKLILVMLLLCGCVSSTPLSRTQLLLDTQVTITLYDQPSSHILDECFALCKKYELLFSRNNPDSELYQLNHQDKSQPIEISKDLANVIKIGLEYSKVSNGNFDLSVGCLVDLWDFKADKPVVPEATAISAALATINYQAIKLEGNMITFNNPNSQIDLGAIAKGYIGDKIKDYLISQDVTSAIINLGGNILCVGKKEEDFKIGISDPQGDGDIVRLKIDDQSVVTSGTYQRYFEADGKYYHHLLDPRTGYSYDNGLASVTIISDQSVIGDVLSTVCFTLGKEAGLALINQTEGVEAIFIDVNNNLFYSNGAKKYLI